MTYLIACSYASAVVAVFSLILVQYFRWCFNFWQKKKVYTPKPSIPFGNGEHFVLQKKAVGEVIRDVYNEIKNKDKAYGECYIFTKPVFLPVNLHLIKRILITDFDHFTDHIGYVNEEVDPLAANLFFMSGLQWKHMRGKLNPTFTPAKIKMMFQTVKRYATELVSVVHQGIEMKKPLDMKDIFSRFTIDVTASCGFGIDSNTLKDPESDFKKYIKLIFSGSMWDAVVRLLLYAVPGLIKLFKVRTFRKEVHDFFINLMDQTVKYRESNHICSKDFMHLLIQLKNNVEISQDDLGDIKNSSFGSARPSLSLNQMAAQAFAFFTGGYEASSVTQTYCLYELVVNPDIQERVREEINMVLNTYGDDITDESLAHMTYLDSCICETLRKYPTLPVITRQCSKSYSFPHSDLVLKEGSYVFISVMGIHYDRDYYPDPERFDPDRFSSNSRDARHPCAWMPFGEGPRICIGARFGMIQVKLGLAALLRNFRFSLNSQTKLPIVMNPRGLGLSPRWKIWLNAERV